MLTMLTALGIVLLAATPTGGAAAFPSDVTLQDALNDLEICRSPLGCHGPSRYYRVLKTRCIDITPVDGRRAIACRADFKLTYPERPEQDSRSHDFCLRFSQQANSSSEVGWSVMQVRDRACEIPSMLTSDPNPMPGRKQLESALVAMLACYDFDGITHCGSQLEKARVETFRCKQIKPGEDYGVRVACRVTGDVRYSTGLLGQRFDNACLRFDRTTPGDESPAHWVSVYVEDKTRCEIT